MLILMSFEREPISFLAAHNGLTPVRFTYRAQSRVRSNLVGPGRVELPHFSLKRRVLYRLSYRPGGSPWI